MSVFKKAIRSEIKMNEQENETWTTDGKFQHEFTNGDDTDETDYKDDDNIRSKTVNKTVKYKETDNDNTSCSYSGENFDFENSYANLKTRFRENDSKYSTVVEGQTTENLMSQFEGFYNEMMSKVKTLRTSTALKNEHREEWVNVDEEKLFKNLKDTPAVQEKLKLIQKFDDDIKDVIDTYNTEKAERLQVQLEMCIDICKNNTLPEKNTQLFLDMCNFEATDSEHDSFKELKEMDLNQSAGQSPLATGSNDRHCSSNTFIKRNIELAREGALARWSLTDEEKSRIEEILSEKDDNVHLNHGMDSASVLETSDSDYDDIAPISNAYVVHDHDKKTIENIDSELEKFAHDEKRNEKVTTVIPDKSDNLWKDGLLKESLKKVDGLLNDLKSSEREEAENEEESI